MVVVVVVVVVGGGKKCTEEFENDVSFFGIAVNFKQN